MVAADMDATGARVPAEAVPAVIGDLEELLRGRLHSAPEGSYSATVVRDPERAARKVVEEAYEVAVELQRPARDADRIASESADLLFHLLAGLVGAGVPFADVLAELDARRGGSR